MMSSYSPFNRPNRMLLTARKPIVMPGNGLMGQYDDQAGFDALAGQFPGANPTGLQSTLQAQLAFAKKQRAQQLGLGQPAQQQKPVQQQQYSPF